jgi:hypothetical protein
LRVRTSAGLTIELRECGCEVLLARGRTPVLAALRTNPYRQGATRELPAFPSIGLAHAHAQQQLELRRSRWQRPAAARGLTGAAIPAAAARPARAV